MIEFCAPASHILIAVPCYTGRPTIEMVASIVSQQNVPCRLEFRSIARDPYIDRARNSLVTEFLLGTQATDLLFIDDDVGFELEAVRKIALTQRPFVGGVYPERKDDTNFPFDLLPGEVATNSEGLLEVSMVPTGFLRLNRAVFDLMPHKEVVERGAKRLDFFRKNEEVGEDVDFCRRWREINGKIFVIPDISFSHTGPKSWEGNLHHHLMERFSGEASRL